MQIILLHGGGGMNSVNITRFRLLSNSLLSKKAAGAVNSQQQSQRTRPGPNSGKTLCTSTHVFCVSLCRCLHFKQSFVVCTSLSSVTGQLVKASTLYSILGKNLLLSACCFARKPNTAQDSWLVLPASLTFPEYCYI